MTGTLLTAGMLVAPSTGLVTLLMVELVAMVSVELLLGFWSQPTSAIAARQVTAERVIIDFINLLFYFR